MKHKRRALFNSVISLLLCFSMLVGTTFAWMTDSVSSGKNLIATGTLDVELYHSNANVTDEQVTTGTNLFLDLQGKPILWEPGAVSYENLRVNNEGDLALAYQMMINTANENYVQEASGVRYSLSQILKVGVVESGITATDRAGVIASVAPENWMKITEFCRNGSLLPEGDGESEQTWGIVIYWEPGDHDNYWNLNNGKTVSSGDALSIDLGIHLIATQEEYESDAFGTDYDVTAKTDVFPVFTPAGSSSTTVVPNEQNQVAEGLVMTAGQVTASVPAGVQLAEGTTELTMSVAEMGATGSNITLGKNEVMRSLDVHIAGVDATNAVPMIIDLGEAMPAGLNIGNLGLYHVENGVSNEMTREMAESDVDAHNEYFYDSVTGRVVLAMATFSEVALIADQKNAWNGNFDYSWYTNANSRIAEADYVIANADQLAAFGAIVGGMNGQTQDSFASKSVKLICDINLGDAEKENNANLIFYPIGYYNNTGSYEKTSGGSVSSSVSSFEGTFDGQGHTIRNFYQNTWEMFGDYNDGYSGTPNHYKDAMGLFGYVYGGTVKNLTVDNFSSDGEFTPTGVIAAYADGKARFENIAITNCNPRVYNTGNGGIIGIAGDTSAANDDHITLKNITVDNSNKISALWGSYDVACGGLVGMYRGNVDGSGNATGDTISFENCHVSAIIDVYNDVCGNYQYYAYRYAGMIIGSVRHNTKNEEGKTIPDMTGISATGCTVNYGDWNDYYYCEFEKNGHPSYSGPDDYKFSRVDKSEISFNENGKATGCKHNHTDAEDNKAIYLPFHQLFTGYSWGVSSIGLKEYSGIVTDLDITEGDQQESVEKFAVALDAKTTLEANKAITVGSLFSAIEGATIIDSAVQVAVSAMNDSDILGTYEANTENWTKGALTFNKIEGMCTVTIQDYNFCKPTSFILSDGKLYQIEKFNKLFTGNFRYRVGNMNPVALSSLFAAEGTPVGNVTVNIETVSGTASATYTAGAPWNNGTIKFENTGVVKVTIQDEDISGIPTELILEVVDAVNATTATNATKNNVVLLNNCGFSSLEVSGGYTLYGNGFTMTCGSDSAALDMGYSFVTLNNGTLDNVQIVTPNFDYAVLYKSNLDEMPAERKQTTDKTRYFNVKSGVMVSGNSQILNSRVSGGRAAVNVSGGNVVIDNSRIELGAVASILVGAANSLTLRDVTLVQKPTASTYDSNKKLMGFSVLTMCTSGGNAAPITLEGKLVQNAWVDEDDKQYVPEDAQNIIDTVMGKEGYLHDINGDGKNESLNLGIAYMPADGEYTVNTPTITDNRSNKDTVPYGAVEVKYSIVTTYVYSYKNTNGTGDSFKTESEYVPNKQNDNITVTYSDTADGLTAGKSYGADGWVYELNVDLDKLSGYALDFSKLSMTVNGVPVADFKVNGNAKPTSPVAVTAGGTTYTLTATVNGKEYTATYKVTGTETSKESPSLVASNYEAGLCVASSYGGTWHGAAPALEGIQIKYWSVAEKQYKTINLSDYTPTTNGQLNGTNTTWTYSPANGDFTLTLTGGQVHSSNKVNAMPVVCNGKLYFVAASSNGLVNSGNSARTIPVSYTFKDNNNGDVLTFSHTWSVAENKNNQYKYSDFCNGTLTKLEDPSCIITGTLMTMADGTQKPVEDLKIGDMLLVFNHITGELEAAPVIFNTHSGDAYDYYDVLNLQFSNGTEVEIVESHGFFDMTLMQYVYIDYENYTDFIGHEFYSYGEKLTLTNAFIEEEYTAIYCPVTYFHMNSFANGMLNTPNIPGGITGLVNYFEYDPDLKYNEEAMKKDIEKYGLYTYADFSDYISEAAYNSSPAVHLKVAVGKGMITFEQILDVIEYLLAGSLIN